MEVLAGAVAGAVASGTITLAFSKPVALAGAVVGALTVSERAAAARRAVVAAQKQPDGNFTVTSITYPNTWCGALAASMQPPQVPITAPCKSELSLLLEPGRDELVAVPVVTGLKFVGFTVGFASLGGMLVGAALGIAARK
jgi:hypothetical protein